MDLVGRFEILFEISPLEIDASHRGAKPILAVIPPLVNWVWMHFLFGCIFFLVLYFGFRDSCNLSLLFTKIFLIVLD